MQFRTAQGILYRCFQKALFIAYIITAAFKIISIDLLYLQQGTQTVRQLDFSARAGIRVLTQEDIVAL